MAHQRAGAEIVGIVTYGLSNSMASPSKPRFACLKIYLAYYRVIDDFVEINYIRENKQVLICSRIYIGAWNRFIFVIEAACD